MQWVTFSHILLVQSAVAVSVFGLLLLVISAMLDGASPGMGTRLRRLGAQGLGASFFVLISHLLMVELFGQNPPVLALIGVYGIVLLMLVQAFLNLFFGPGVGTRVTADLLSSLFHYSIRIIFLPVEAIRRAMQKP